MTPWHPEGTRERLLGIFRNETTFASSPTDKTIQERQVYACHSYRGMQGWGKFTDSSSLVSFRDGWFFWVFFFLLNKTASVQWNNWFVAFKQFMYLQLAVMFGNLWNRSLITQGNFLDPQKCLCATLNELKYTQYLDCCRWHQCRLWAILA